MADLKIYEEKMEKTVSVLKEEFNTIRVGRANPHVLDKIRVDYYGTPTPIQQVGNVTVPEARIIQIAPWEKSLLKAIEKALDQARHHVVVCLPYSMGGLVETLHNNAQVKTVEYTGEGIEIEVILDDILYGRVRDYVIKEL